jgi:hypothetical protein
MLCAMFALPVFTMINVAIEQGLAFYCSTLFDQDGTAKYYHNRCYWLDVPSVSQAVFTWLKVGDGKANTLLGKSIMPPSIDTLYRPGKQRDVYQKHQCFTQHINYTCFDIDLGKRALLFIAIISIVIPTIAIAILFKLLSIYKVKY